MLYERMMNGNISFMELSSSVLNPVVSLQVGRYICLVSSFCSSSRSSSNDSNTMVVVVVTIVEAMNGIFSN